MSALRRWLREERASEHAHDVADALAELPKPVGADGQPFDDNRNHPLHPDHWTNGTTRWFAFDNEPRLYMDRATRIALSAQLLAMRANGQPTR